MPFPWRPAPFAAALFTGALVLGHLTMTAVPGPALTLVGGDDSPVGRLGGLVLEVTLPGDGAADVIGARAASLGALDTRVRDLGGGRFEVSLAGLDPAGGDDAAHILTTRNRLAFHRVAHDTPFGAELHARAERGELGPVTADVDAWPVDHGPARRDPFLVARDEATLVAALADVRGPDEYQLMVGPVIDDGSPTARTWVVHREPVVDDRDVAEAVVSFDPNTTKPIVLLDFTRDGGRRFGEATSAHVGDRIAIVLDGRVVSAPVINGPILGGRASITMGTGGDVEAEANALAASLNSASPLPADVQARVLRAVQPAPGRTLAAALLCAGGAAAVVLALGLVLLRRSAAWPALRLPAGRAGAADTVRRAAVTAAAIAGCVSLGAWTLPTADLDIPGLVPRGWYDPTLSVGALGIAPLVGAAILAELLGLLVPAWRRRRHAGYAARGPLRIVAGVLAVALTLVQAVLFTRLLQHSHPDTSIVEPTPLAFAITAGLVAGSVLVQALAALWISRHGLGHGLAVLTAVALVPELGGLGALRGWPLIIVAAEAGLVAVVTAAVVRTRIDIGAGRSLRLPLAGVIPVHHGALLVAVVEIGATSAALSYAAVRALPSSSGLAVAGAALATAVLAWCFTRPVPLRTLPGPTLVSIGYVVVVTAAAIAALESAGTTVALPAALLTAIGLDVVAEARARWRGPLVAIAEYHDVDAADAALDAQGGLLRSVHLRALLRFFGPHVPVWHLVPADAAADQAPATTQATSGRR